MGFGINTGFYVGLALLALVGILVLTGNCNFAVDTQFGVK